MTSNEEYKTKMEMLTKEIEQTAKKLGCTTEDVISKLLVELGSSTKQ